MAREGPQPPQTGKNINYSDNKRYDFLKVALLIPLKPVPNPAEPEVGDAESSAPADEEILLLAAGILSKETVFVSQWTLTFFQATHQRVKMS